MQFLKLAFIAVMAATSLAAPATGTGSEVFRL
jgi:hypothetical protein